MAKMPPKTATIINYHQSLSELRPPKTDRFVCGFVVSCSQQPKHTRTGEFMISVAVADEADWPNRNDSDTQLLVVNIFRQQSTQLPPTPIAESTIICFARLKLQMYGKLQGVCFKQDLVALFHPNTASVPGQDEAASWWISGENETIKLPLERVCQLKNWWQQQQLMAPPSIDAAADAMIVDLSGNSSFNTSTMMPPASSTSSRRSTQQQRTAGAPSRRPLYQAKDIRKPNEFFDFIGEVLHVAIDDLKSVLTVTDYTVLKQAIRCTLWDNHGRDCHELTAGMFVRIDNLRMKLDGGGRMEAVLNGGGTRKLSILPAEDEAVKDLLERRERQAWADVLQNSQFDFPIDSPSSPSPQQSDPPRQIQSNQKQVDYEAPRKTEDAHLLVVSLLEVSQVDETPKKFKCRVYFTDYYPKNTSVYSSTKDLCDYCQSSKHCTLVSLVGLLATDSSFSLPLLKFATTCAAETVCVELEFNIPFNRDYGGNNQNSPPAASSPAPQLLDGNDFHQQFIDAKSIPFEITIISFPVFSSDGRRIIMYRLMDAEPID